MQSLLILGRQPELGLAELESLYGPKKVRPLPPKAVLLDVEPSLLAFNRLGGSQKAAKLLKTLDTTDWRDIEGYLIKSTAESSKSLPEGKITLGLSLYGFNMDSRSIIASALKIKKVIKKTGRSIRLVPNKTEELNSAQVIHNKLTGSRGLELLIIKSSDKTYIAQTLAVQDIDAYSSRDQARPYRDSKVGMLPPKLAQIIINLAAGKLNEDQIQSIDIGNLPAAPLNQAVLDPFCGSGVILQEAFLMGYDLIGSDLNPRMVEYSKNNLSWLGDIYHTAVNADLTVADAQTKQWPSFNFVATETNLGKPLTSLPSELEMRSITSGANGLIERFLRNIASQAPSGLRLCVAVPAWQLSKDHFKSLPLIDHLSDLGYNLVDFEHAGTRGLIYYRPDQIVARELLTITRK